MTTTPTPSGSASADLGSPGDPGASPNGSVPLTKTTEGGPGTEGGPAPSEAPTAPAPADQAGPTALSGASVHFTDRQIKMIMLGLVSGMFLGALDQTIVSASIRTIADDLNGLSIQAWATTAYLITSTITTPLYGKFSDSYGRRPFFITAITVFILGSALCGFANSMYQLAFYRGLQGLGAGGLFSLALAIIGDIVPPRERARYQGFFLAVFGTSSVLGPVVGGFLAGQSSILGITGWRWVFLVNVPIGLLSLLLVTRTLHLPHIRRPQRIDYFGALMLVVGLVPLLVVAEQGREWGWTSGRSIACYAVGAVGTVLFVVVEHLMGEAALLPLRLFKARTFAVASGVNLIVGMGMFGGLASLPLYLQIVKGKSPTEAGLLLLPLMMGIIGGSIGSGQSTSRTGRYRHFPIIGLFLLVGSLALMTRITADTSLYEIDAYAFLFGLGLGFNMQTLVLAVQNSVRPQDMGVATSSVTFFRQMGGTLGTAVFLSVLFNTLPDKIAAASKAIVPTPAYQAALHDPANKASVAMLSKMSQSSGGVQLNDSSFLSSLDPRLARPFLVGFAESVDLVFLLAGIVTVIGLVLVWFLPEEKLRSHSGLQGQHADAEARKEAAQEAAAAAAAG